MHIFLIGFKSCGKSTVGRALAALTDRPFVDTDAEVERLFYERHGQSLGCREIFRQQGESFLRALETAALYRLSEQGDAVVATGGGIVLHDKNRELLRSTGTCVFLDVPLHILEKRLEAHASSPLFRKKSVSALHAERYPVYIATAHIHCPIPEDAGPKDAAKEIQRRMRKE